MIVLGVLLLILLWILGDAGIILPAPLPVLIHDVGIILIVLGIIFLILGFLGYAPGPGIGAPRGNRRFYY